MNRTAMDMNNPIHVQNAALTNPVLISKLSAKDLHNFRTITLLHYETSFWYKRIHSPIHLKNADDVVRFMKCMADRTQLLKTSNNLYSNFPFSAFNLNLSIGYETLHKFGQAYGAEIRRLTFTFHNDTKTEALEMTKLCMLLSFCAQIEEIRVASSTTFPLKISDEDRDRLLTFFPKLRNIDMTYSNYAHARWNWNRLHKHFLLDILIQRSHGLKFYVLPCPSKRLLPYEFLLDENLINILADNHSNTRVALPQDKVLSLSPTHHFGPGFEALRQTNFKFERFPVQLVTKVFNDETLTNEEVETFLQQFSEWLATQTDSLTTLSLDFSRFIKTRVPGDVPFPPLHSLTDLAVNFNYLDTHEQQPSAWPWPTLAPGGFPNLKKLCLKDYREEYAIFGSSPLPSIQELRLNSYKAPANPSPWHETFPNLTSLQVELRCDDAERAKSIVRSILKCHGLIHLDLQLVKYSTSHNVETCIPDLWDSLTGGAPKLANLLGELNIVANAQVQDLPSLSNLRALKTLRFRPGNLSNLEAVKFMYSTRRQVPLEKLCLVNTDTDLKDQVKPLTLKAYQSQLISTNKEVEFC